VVYVGVPGVLVPVLYPVLVTDKLEVYVGVPGVLVPVFIKVVVLELVYIEVDDMDGVKVTDTDVVNVTVPGVGVDEIYALFDPEGVNKLSKLL